MTLAGLLGYRNKTVICRDAGRPPDGRSTGAMPPQVRRERS